MSDQLSIPIPLTRERRLARVAAILARGIIRLRGSAEHSDPPNLDESRPSDREVVSESRLCVSSRPEAGDWRNCSPKSPRIGTSSLQSQVFSLLRETQVPVGLALRTREARRDDRQAVGSGLRRTRRGTGP
jgi:hypothetical protein